MDPDGSDAIVLADEGFQYFQPIWAPESRVVAWGQGDGQEFAVAIANEDRSDPLVVPVGGFPFYLYWSPDELRIGALHNGVTGSVDFAIVDVGSGSAQVAGSGSPFYFSWSPDGDALAVHVEGTRLEIQDESANPVDLGEVASNFLAPQWTDTGLFYFNDQGLILRDQSGSESVVLDAQGFVSINPNPDGTKVALHVLSGDAPGVTVGLSAQESAETDAISIIDIESGEVAVVAGQLPVGSFWSPDGTKLLMLLVSDRQGLVDVRVWESGEVADLDTVSLPASWVNQVLPFLDQYTQSIRLWSPDSNSFVLPATREDDSGIWVYPIDGATPVLVSGGQWASWSHD